MFGRLNMNSGGLLTFLLKLLVDKVPKRWVWLTLIIAGFPYCLKLVSPTSYKLFTISVIESVNIIEVYWIRLCCLIVILTLGYILLRKSNSVFFEELKRSHPKYKSYQAKKDILIQTTVGEERKNVNSKRMIRRQIIIENKLDTEIRYLKGKISFFENRIKICDDIPFEEEHIAPYGGVNIFDSMIDSDDSSWNGFHIYIEKIEYSDKIEVNLKLNGLRFSRNYSWVLNRYNYRLFGIIRVKFELSWLKEQWAWKIKPWLLNYPRLPRIYVYRGYKFPFKERMKYFWKRKLNQFIWISVVAPVCMFLYLAFSGFVFVSWELIQVWFDFSHKMFLKIYT